MSLWWQHPHGRSRHGVIRRWRLPVRIRDVVCERPPAVLLLLLLLWLLLLRRAPHPEAVVVAVVDVVGRLLLL